MHVIAEAHTEITGIHVLIEIPYDERIDDFRTRFLQPYQRLFEHRGNFRVTVISVDERA